MQAKVLLVFGQEFMGSLVYSAEPWNWREIHAGAVRNVRIESFNIERLKFAASYKRRIAKVVQENMSVAKMRSI